MAAPPLLRRSVVRQSARARSRRLPESPEQVRHVAYRSDPTRSANDLRSRMLRSILMAITSTITPPMMSHTHHGVNS